MRDTVVNTFGRLYNEIFTDQKKYHARKRSPESTRGAHEAGGAPSTLVEASCPSRTASYFPIFLNIPKRRKGCLGIEDRVEKRGTIRDQQG